MGISDVIYLWSPPVLKSSSANLVFVLALIGFGTKAGLVPLHVWLPEAHPAAPSHVSALMSGVMIKMGIYGLLRFASFLGEPAAWWGVCLAVLGLFSGLVGISLAVSQRNFKRSFGLFKHRKHRTDCFFAGTWALGNERASAEYCRARIDRRTSARVEPQRHERAAVLGGRQRAPRHGHQGLRTAWRPDEAAPVDKHRDSRG